MLPSRGSIGIFIWVVVGLSVIVSRLIESPDKTGPETSGVGAIRGLLQRKFRKMTDHSIRK
jgi:hypothetical protein